MSSPLFELPIINHARAVTKLVSSPLRSLRFMHNLDSNRIPSVGIQRARRDVESSSPFRSPTAFMGAAWTYPELVNDQTDQCDATLFCSGLELKSPMRLRIPPPLCIPATPFVAKSLLETEYSRPISTTSASCVAFSSDFSHSNAMFRDIISPKAGFWNCITPSSRWLLTPRLINSSGSDSIIMPPTSLDHPP